MLLDIDAQRFARCFPHDAFALRHGLTANPLLTSHALEHLAEILPSGLHEQSRAELPILVPGGEGEALDHDLAELVRNVERYRRRVSLRYVERVPAYAQLIDTVLEDATPFVAPLEGIIFRTAGFVFLSADGAITPVHCDPEYNFLLQLRGTKQVNVGALDDATIQRAMEHQHSGGNRNIGVIPAEFETFELTPGDGLFIPPEAPHWVENGSEISVSLSVTFYTKRIARTERVHGFNRKLRSIGLSPTPPGRSELSDRAKATAVRAHELARHRLRVRGRQRRPAAAENAR